MTNHYRHKGATELYAHYSAIDEYDLDRFPDLALAHPIHITLTQGQSLYIPANWWHWVRTPGKSFAINYWFRNEIGTDPFNFEHTVPIDVRTLGGIEVHIWNSHRDNNGTAKTELKKFEEFYNSGEDHRYVLTLGAYHLGRSNNHLKDILSPHVTFPIDERIQLTGNYDFNVWSSSGKHDTGLHYDDEDGVLTVIEGTKEITLYPPSDTPYLSAYPVSYPWRNQSAVSYRYNMGKCMGPVHGIPSSELLYVTCNGNRRVLANISKLYKEHQSEKSLIWGFKKEGENYRWEVYYDNLQNSGIRIMSWDIYPGERNVSAVDHYYYKEDDNAPVSLPFWGYGKCMSDGELCTESKIFVLDQYRTFERNYNSYMEKLGFAEIANEFKEVILNKYSCYSICIHNKKPGQIFVQYLGLTNEEFKSFLTENDYPPHISDFVSRKVETGDYHINNEVTLVYETTSKCVVRSGFYGNL